MKKDNSLSLLEVTTTDAPESKAVPILSLLEETTPENGGGYHDKPKKAAKKPFAEQYRIFFHQHTAGGMMLQERVEPMPDKATAEAVFRAYCFEDGIFYDFVQLQVKKTAKGKWQEVETYALPTEEFILRTFTGKLDDLSLLSEDRFDDFEQAVAAYENELQGNRHHVTLMYHNYRERTCELLATERGFLPNKQPMKQAV